MKIHIDTSPSSKNNKKDGAGSTGTTSNKSPQGKKSTASQAGAHQAQQQQPIAAPAPVQPKPIPSKLPKESTPPKDVAQARKLRSQSLKRRQGAETDGSLKGPDRDIDPGTSFGPALIPYLL